MRLRDTLVADTMAPVPRKQNLVLNFFGSSPDGNGFSEMFFLD